MSAPTLSAVLIVDDDPAIGNLLTRLIQRHFPERPVYTCQSSAQAHAYALRAPVACVLTDYALKHEDGVGLAQTLHVHWPKLPIILVAGVMPTDTVELAHHFAMVLTQPINVDMLCTVVQMYISCAIED